MVLFFFCLFQEPLKEMVLFFFCLFQEPLKEKGCRSKKRKEGLSFLVLLFCCSAVQRKADNVFGLKQTTFLVWSRQRFGFVYLFQEGQEEKKTRFCFKEETQSVCFRKENQVLFQKRRPGVLLLCSRKPGVLLFKKTRFCFTTNKVFFCSITNNVIEQKNTWLVVSCYLLVVSC